MEGQLIQLAEDLNSANRLANTTQTLINSSQSSLDDAAVLLSASENRANSSRSALSELDLELDRLELLIMQNEMELERARNLTSEAVDTANQTEQVCMVTAPILLTCPRECVTLLSTSCMYVCMYVCMLYVCMYVCMMYVCMYVCMYVHM